MYYCLGYIFNKDMSQVILLEKNKPENQKGKMNGIGGKIEKNEYTWAAMARECKEETGLIIGADDWNYLGTMHTRESKDVVEVFYHIYQDDWYGLSLPWCAEGELQFRSVPHLHLCSNLMENVLWMVYFILDKEKTKSDKIFLLDY